MTAGYNGTIFAYGQTGAGKTYTIQGPGFEDATADDEASRGLMPRSFEFLFRRIKEDSADSEFLVRASYLEIYNEQIIDLLDPNSFNLQIREDIKKGVYVEGLTEETVATAPEM